MVQVCCPNCNIWQFEVEKCSECGILLRYEKDILGPTEYRVELKTWRDNVPRKIRLRVYERDEYICQYCGKWCYESYVNDGKAVTIDHAIPVASGGTNDIENLVTCCRECNLRKSALIFETFEDARKYLNGNR